MSSNQLDKLFGKIEAIATAQDEAVTFDGFVPMTTTDGLAIGSLMSVHYRNPYDYKRKKEIVKNEYTEKNLVLEFVVHGQHDRMLSVNCVIYPNQRDVLKEGSHLQVLLAQLGYDVPKKLASIPEKDFVARAEIAEELRKVDIVPVLESYLKHTFCFDLQETRIEKGKPSRFVIKAETIRLYDEVQDGKA